MSIILELRGRTSHAGVPLVHPTSESVVLGSVFGIVKNLSFDAVLNVWLAGVLGKEGIATDEWHFSFWERQKIGSGDQEGSTEVDLVLDSPKSLVFIEVKMGAAPSAGPAHDPERDQLVRNLDVGGRGAREEGKAFALVYITPDVAEPEVVGRTRSSARDVPAPPLFWSSWGRIADVLAQALREQVLTDVEQAFALDLLAYLAGKRLWANTLEDDPIFYQDKLYRSLRVSDSPFIPYEGRSSQSDQSWRRNPWDEAGLREFLDGLRAESKLLLKVMAESGGSIRQDRLMQAIPSLRGRTTASLRALKSQVNAACRGRGKAPVLAVGTRSGGHRIHEIDPGLGGLREVVIEVASAFEIPAHLLDCSS